MFFKILTCVLLIKTQDLSYWASKTSVFCWYRLSDVYTELLSSFKVLGSFPFLFQIQCNRTPGNP